MENQEQKPIPEIPTTPEQPIKKQKPKWIVPAIVIAGIIILGVGGWAGYNYLIKPDTPVVPEEERLEQECKMLWWYDNEYTFCQEPKQFCGAYMYLGLETFETKKECEDRLIVRDWKIYRNEEYGFEFKYPPYFGPVQAERYFFKPPFREESEMILLSFPNDSFDIEIIIPKEHKEHKKEDLICENGYIQKESVEYCKNIIVANQDISYEVALRQASEWSDFFFMSQKAILYMEQDNFRGEITFLQAFPEIDEKIENYVDYTEIKEVAYGYLEKMYNGDMSQPETQLVEQFEKILSTFKFIESGSPVDYFIYRNGELGFETQYSKDWYVGHDDSKTVEFSKGYGTGYTIYVRLLDNDKNLSIEDWWLDYVSKYHEALRNTTLERSVRKTVNINGIQSYYVTNPETWEGKPYSQVGLTWANLYVPRDNYVYQINSVFGRDIFSDEENYSEIAKNFKFIELDKTAYWKVYRSKELGIEFKYPEAWGNVILKDTSFNYEDLPEDSKIYYSDIDLNKALTESYSIKFEKKPCSAKGFCSIGLYLYVFSNEKPLQVSCYEGACNVENLIDDRENIKETSNKNINSRPGYCKDWHFVPGASVQRTCRLYNEDLKISLEMGYGKNNYTEIEPIDYRNFIFEDILDKLGNKVDFELFLDNYNILLNSIKLSRF